MIGSSAPTALVSWAHRDQNWSDRQAEKWIGNVVEFATLLRLNGVDADLDLWNENDASIDWTRWGQLEVQKCELVIIAASAAWRQRWEGTNSPKSGAGAVAEADTLKGLFNSDQSAFQRRTVIALLPGVEMEAVPLDLHRLRRFHVKSLDASGMEQLLRSIHQRPLHNKPALGPIPALPSISYLTPTSPGSQDIAAKRVELDAMQSGSVPSLEGEVPTTPAPFDRPPLFTVSRTRREVFVKSMRMDIHEIVRQLTSRLGPVTVAALANVNDQKLPQEWSTDDGSQPSEESRQRLMLAYRIWTELSQSENDNTASNWFIGPNPRLGGKSPAESLRNGRLKEVADAADAFLESTDN